MALTAVAATAGTGLLSMYVAAKTQLSEDIRALNAARNYTKGIAKAVQEGTLSLFNVLQANARTRPTAPSIYYAGTGEEETWLSTYTTVLRYAEFLHQHNVKPADVVAVDYTNKPTILHLWLALACLGATPAFINYNLTGDRLLHCLRVSGAKLLVVDDEVADNVLSSLKPIQEMDITIEILDKEQLNTISRLPEHKPTFDPRQNTPLTNSCIFYTSGTTGFPKPAVFTLFKWYASGLMMGKFLKLAPNDRFYSSMPIYHGSASSCFVMTLFHGGCFCIGHKFSVSRFWDEVRQSRATVISYVGETLRYLLGAAPSPRDRDHLVHSAYGNGLRPDVWREFRERFGVTNILEFYGASEGIGSTFIYNSGPYGVGSVGRDGMLMRFLKRNDLIAIRIDPETLEPERNKAGFCSKVNQNEPGEVLMRIPERDFFQGYYGNPEATQEKILKDVVKRGDLWFRTGDLLRQDSDGFWYFVDRLGETFRWRAENVSTMEVASALAHFPDVVEIAAYGVQLPHHEGRAGCVAVVPRQPETFNWKGFLQFAKDSLPKYAVPLFVRMTPEIAKLENNKQLKGPLMKEGVDPAKVAVADTIFWLKSGITSETYAKFTEQDWSGLQAGTITL